MLQDFLRSLNDPGEFAIRTWAQYDYLMELTEELLAFASRPRTEDDTLEIIKLLIGHNFNALSFYAFMLTHIEESSASHYAFEEQELALMEWLRLVGNVRQEKQRGYLHDVPSIAESLSGSIDRQLHHISQQKKLYGVANGPTQAMLFYFHVALNVQELLFLFRVFIETGFAKVKQKALIYAFVRNHIRTNSGRAASDQYMRNIFSPHHVITPKVARTVRAWLMNMVNHIDKHYL